MEADKRIGKMKYFDEEKHIEYIGKLNEHEAYLKVLDVLEEKTEYIEMVIIDQKKSNHLVSQFENDIILKKKVSQWWCTKTSARNYLYRIQASQELFEYLRSFETFCKYCASDNRGAYCDNTDFGYDDIAFYDKCGEILLGTCTHEGHIIVHNRIHNMLTKVYWQIFSNKGREGV